MTDTVLFRILYLVRSAGYKSKVRPICVVKACRVHLLTSAPDVVSCQYDVPAALPREIKSVTHWKIG